MVQWETCNISDIYLRTVKVKSGRFSTTDARIIQWVANKTGTAGSQTIYKSEEFQSGMVETTDWEKRGKEYQKMISHLLNEGWEPAATKENGQITLMKRQITESAPQAASDPVNLLKQLANLHDAGILTDQEFQAKKAELLKRM